jgi:hypothetical protein
MRTLVITPCSAKKQVQVQHPARAVDLATPAGRRSAGARLGAHALPAADMYTGTHHRLVMEGIRAVWAACGPEVLELSILSGGFGMLHAEDRIIPYDVSLDEFDEAGLTGWIAQLAIPEQAASIVADHDLVFHLLDGRYLAALSLPLEKTGGVQQIVLTDEESLALVPDRANYTAIVAAGGVAARRWHVKAPHVRGFLFRRMCLQIVQHGPALLEWLQHHPEDAEKLFYKRARWRPQLALW